MGNGTYFNLDPYDGTQITQYEAREFPLELNFVINNKTEDPMLGSTYVGIEIIRLYVFGSVNDRVNLYRNGNLAGFEGTTATCNGTLRAKPR